MPMAVENGWPTRKRAHHQFDGVGQLFFQQRHPLFGLAVDPDIDPADAHDDAEDDAHRRAAAAVHDRQHEEGEHRHQTP